MDDITDAVVDNIVTTCLDCGDVSINEELFVCFTESPTYVTYRARIEGTSQTNSSFLVSLIESWVRSGDARIIVTRLLLTVDDECSVSIPSIDISWECEAPNSYQQPSPTLTLTTNNNNQSNINAIIGGASALFIILIIIATIIIVVIVLMMRRYKNNL